MASWVYIITNASGPGLLKVGFTDRAPEVRAKELGATGLPSPYVVAYAAQVRDGRAIEREAHARLAEYHVGKEWFRCSVSTARIVLDELCGDFHSDSPLVPGHALEDFFRSKAPSYAENSTSADDEDESPYPPGHPLRGML